MFTTELTPDVVIVTPVKGALDTPVQKLMTGSSAYKNLNKFFGCPMAMSEDGTIVVIGREKEDSDKIPQSGAAYVLHKNTLGEWEIAAILAPEDGMSGCCFGFSVAISGDGRIIAIGAVYSNSDNYVQTGKVYLYSQFNQDKRWQLHAILTPSVKKIGDLFGYSIAISKHAEYIAVGAKLANFKNATTYGAVYLYHRYPANNTTLANLYSYVESQVLTAAENTINFGSALAISANGDRLVVAAHRAYAQQKGYEKHGSVSIFHREGGQLVIETQLVNDSMLFGHALALSAKGDRLVIGEPMATISQAKLHGNVYVVQRAATTWSYIAKLSSEQDHLDYFGCAVAITPDGSRIVVGASLTAVLGVTDYTRCSDEEYIKQAGMAYIYDVIAGVAVFQQQVIADIRESGQGFSTAICLSSDGKTLAALGQVGNKQKTSARAMAYLYQLT